MTWLSISDRQMALQSKSDTNLMLNMISAEQDTLLATGSLVVDFDFSLGQNAPCKLISYTDDTGWLRRFTIYLNADHSLSLECSQGNSQCYARLSNINLQEVGAVRLTYSWDAPGLFGLLSAEIIEENTIHQAAVKDPIPLPLCDANFIVSGSDNTVYDERTIALALSDQIVPVGPAPSISAGAMIATTEGPRAIERLRLGDLVRTKDNGTQTVRWIIKQDLPAIGGTAPIRLSAPFFGLQQDIITARNQRILISGIETEYNLGQDAVSIDAQDLLTHHGVRPVVGAISTTYYQIVLDNHDCICVSGVWADSLYVGHLKNTPEILATTGLATMPGAILPVHQKHGHPVLRHYERQALLDTLIA
ncbi:MAG: Hint domain-containing protein [Paracoccaceae bacterium]